MEKAIKKFIEKRLGKGKAIFLVGPRQVGKTIPFNQVLGGRDFLFLNGGDRTVRKILPVKTPLG